MTDRGSLVVTLEGLAAHLGSIPLHLAGPEAEAERDAARRLAAEYLAPRLLAPRGPLVVAVVGPSGSGKSTLVNSLAASEVSPAGALRPTTTRPVVWTADVVPATLDGLLGRLGGRVVDGGASPPDGVVVVDTPPPGIGEAAAQALAVADACVVVVTGLRYADVVAWDLIGMAADRRLPTTFVLNRLPEAPEAQRAVLDDFTRRLESEGLAGAPGAEPVIAVADGPVGPAGLPAEWVTGLRKELEALGSIEQRAGVLRLVTGAALVRLRMQLDAVRSALVDDAVERNRLADPARSAYRVEADLLASDLASGSFCDLASDRRSAAADLAAIVTRRAGRAARAAAETWERRPSGRLLLAAAPGLWSHGPDTVSGARARCLEWYQGLEEMVAPVAGRWLGKRRTRVLAASLAAAALDPQRRPDGRIARRLDRVPGSVATARRALVAAFRDVLELDSGRFLAAVGAGPPPGVLGRLSLDPGEGG